jgi:hypothetical protein
MDAILGTFCVLAGAVLAIVGAVVLAIGGYTLAVGHGGSWWIVELFYVLIGLGLGCVALLSGRYGLELLRQSRTKS